MLCNLANQMLCTKLQHFALSAGKAKLLSSTCLCYASLEASFCFWLVHAMFPEGTFDSDQYFDHEVLAQLTLHCMERGQYTRAAKLLLSGLSAGVHDSYQYIDAYKQFLAHATRQLFSGQDVSSTEDKISLACLQEVFVQWAWVLRCYAKHMSQPCCRRYVLCVLFIAF